MMPAKRTDYRTEKRAVRDRWRRRSRVAALVFCIGLTAGTSGGEEMQSPIRASLPGFVPTQIELPSPTRLAAVVTFGAIEDLAPLAESAQPVASQALTKQYRRQSPIRIALPKPRLRGDEQFRGEKQSQTPQIRRHYAATPFNVGDFDNSIRWSLLSDEGSRDQSSRDLHDAPRLRTATPFDAERFAQAISASLLELQDQSEPVMTPVTPFDVVRFQRSMARSLPIGPTVIDPKKLEHTDYDLDGFEDSIDESLSAVQQHVAVSALTRTDFDTDQFERSITKSLPAPPIVIDAAKIPRTSYDTAGFERSITKSLPSTPTPIDAESIPCTPYDRAGFERSILQSVPAGERQVAPGLPETGFDANQFRRSLIDALRNDGSMEGLPLESTPFDLLEFDRSIEASLAADGDSPTLTDNSEDILSSPLESCAQPWHPLLDFSPTPVDGDSMHHDAGREAWVYDAKREFPVQHPWVEWGRIFYGDGITPRGINLFGRKNLVRPKFYLYGDLRSGVMASRNAAGRNDNWANRLNLEMDLQVTDTERFHAFVGPIDRNGQFTRLELVDGDFRFRDEIDFTPATGFFEGDLGVLMGAAHNRTSPFELPFTIGLIPLIFQNGIWMEDAVAGAAFAIPARHSNLLNWSNYDATFFAVFDQLNSPAFGANANAAQAFGTAWFIEAYGGYIESGYAYLNDRNRSALSYHNITTSFTRRYFDRLSNSVRVIVNSGQDLPQQDRTADGVLLLVENSWITPWPLTFVPYANFFAGWDRPQSVARAGVSGGILRNTGINFETDALNGYPTLDPTGNNTAGGSIGVDLIGDDLDRQLLLELAFVAPHGNKNPLVPGDQYALGSRYQFNLSRRTLLRFDGMYGWRRGLQDIYGTRMEFRWKF